MSFPVRKVKSVWLWCTDPLGQGRDLLQWELGRSPPAGTQLVGGPRRVLAGRCPQPLTHRMVIIFVWLFLELSLFILAMLSGVWNFSVLMKSTGLGTFGYSAFSRGNIQASRATAHLQQDGCPALLPTRQLPFPPG